MHNRWWRALIAALLGLALVSLVPTAADAQQPNDGWSTNGKVGYCAQRSGGFAVAAQNYLWTSDAYKYVDNAWGANSDSTMKAFQSRFGLTADGCVGPNTWNVMRSTVYSACSPGYACNLPNYSVGITNGSGQIVRQSWFSRSNCDWGSYIQAGINTGPIAANTTYDFSSSLSVGIGWCA